MDCDEDDTTPNYFSLQDLIATQIKVPCRVEKPLHNFGFLDPNAKQNDFPVGFEVEIPLWAAEALARPSKQIISFQLPNGFQESTRQVLQAEPTVVNLNKASPHFYQTALHLTRMHHPEVEELAEILPHVMKTRLKTIANIYINATDTKSADDGSEAKQKDLLKECDMDELEKKIFTESSRGFAEIRKYLERPRVELQFDNIFRGARNADQ